MNPLYPNAVEMQVACWRMAGYAVSTNLRIMRIVTQSAMQAPFLPVTTLKAAVKARANLCQAMSEATPVAAMASQPSMTLAA